MSEAPKDPVATDPTANRAAERPASDEPRVLDARELQGESEAAPGSDVDQANQSPHVG